MKHILAQANVDVLRQLAWARVLLGFDFDGTLAPIVTDRDGARLRARTGRLLTRACGLYPCAVISGRGQNDVAKRLGGAPARYIVGNHGLEPGAGIEAFAAEVDAARARLEAALGHLGGVEIEDKRYSLAIHYRGARRPRLAREAIHDAVRALPVAMRLVAGKMVVNVVPARAPNKGDALLLLREKAGADTALYVGDDVTDEDVFELDQPGRLLTIRVGESSTSAASYFLRTQAEIDVLLTTLIQLRERGAST